MNILCGAIVPHPTVLIDKKRNNDEVNKLEVIRQGMQDIRKKIFANSPETLVFISPHGSCFADAFAIKKEPVLKGLAAGEEKYLEVPCDQELADQILHESKFLGIPAVGLEKSRFEDEASAYLDHGVFIPLTLFQDKINLPIVSISICDLGIFDHYRLGVALERASGGLGRRIAVVASGSLSSSQIEDRNSFEEARELDQQVIDAISEEDFRRIIDMDSSQIDDVRGCGFLPLVVLAGSFDGYKVATEIVTYSSPFGDGYLVALVKPVRRDERMRLFEEIPYLQSSKRERKRKRVSTPVHIARKAVETYVKEHKAIKPPKNLPDYLKKPAAVFVSLKKGKALRGCIGTTKPTTASAAEEIIQNAIHSAMQDPRFFPVKVSELSYLEYSVDILGDLEEVSDESQLDHKMYGVYVMCGGRCGLLLPDIDGVDSVGQQVSIARQKGGIAEDEDYQLFRFRVERYR